MAKIKKGDLVQVITGAKACIAASGSTENADGQDFLGTRVVGNLKPRLLLNH